MKEFPDAGAPSIMSFAPAEMLPGASSGWPQAETCKVAVLLLCYNEAAAIASVVKSFRQLLPDAAAYVFDNASTDGIAERAASADALVRHEPRRGKGNVVRRMFANIEADIYLMADGDGTYDPLAAPRMVEIMCRDRLDMVVGVRQHTEDVAYRAGHALGNKLFNWLLARAFARQFTDIFSGYRVFSRRFVRSFPAIAGGFEIETEISVHARDLKIPFAEIPVAYFKRPSGSESKLRTYRDGMRILSFILLLLKDIKPAFFFGVLALGPGLGLGVVGHAFGTIPIVDYMRTGLVPHLPSAILSVGIMVLASISMVSGIILDSVVPTCLEPDQGQTALIKGKGFKACRTIPEVPDGHYDRKGLTSVLEQAGFTIEQARHIDSAGFFASLTYKLVGDKDGNLNPAMIGLYDRYVFPVSLAVDRITSSFLGKNLLASARRPA